MLLEINFTIVLFTISFLIFIYLLNLTLYKPVGQIIEERKNIIEGDIEKSKEFSEEANKLIENYKNQIKLARQQSQQIIQEFINKAQKEREEKVSVLLSELMKEKESALKQLEAEKATAMQKVEKEINSLANLITESILGENKTLARTH